MMVHNWGIQHVKIRFVSKAANDDGFLDPEVGGILYKVRFTLTPNELSATDLYLSVKLQKPDE